MKRDFITLQEYSSEEIKFLLDLSFTLKKEQNPLRQDLKGKSVGLVFQKPSNRTRVSFEVAVWELGGNSLYLGPDEINLGKRESVADVAQTLSRYLDCIVARTYSHDDILKLCQYSTVPVINGLSDLCHPCQALADIFSIQEKFGTFKGIAVAYVGDGNNVCHSLMIACSKVGLNLNIATPKGYEPDKNILAKTQSQAEKLGAKIKILKSPEEAVKGVQVIYSDVWVSMGQEEETKKRLKEFKGFQINPKIVKLADKNYVFMHCLPAHRGQEVTDEIIDGPNSIVFDQAENRLHVQKAILTFLFNPINKGIPITGPNTKRGSR